MTDARNMNIELDDEEDMSFMNDMPDKLKSGNATSEELDRLAKVLQEI
jgi:hypothetical protein